MLETIKDTGTQQARGTHSAGVKLGDFIFVSGQLPLLKDGTVCTGDIREQTELCIENMQAVLKACGLCLSYVVQVRIYLTDMAEEEAMSEVFDRYFNAPSPARLCVGVSSLQGGAHVEIEAYAVDTRALDILCAGQCNDSCCGI